MRLVPSWIAKNRHVLWLSMLLLTSTAQAHVKWFAKVDPAEVPRPIGDVLSEPFFVQMLMLSLVDIYLFFLIYRVALRRGVLAALDARMKRFDGSSI